eukprot:tig00000344_g24296.t1
MRLRLLPLRSSAERTVAVWTLSSDGSGDGWVGLLPALQELEAEGAAAAGFSRADIERLRVAAADVLLWLELSVGAAGEFDVRAATKRLLEFVQADRSRWERCTEACDAAATLLPFAPKSFRDFSIYTPHLKAATRGLLKLSPSSALQILCGGLARILRLPLPLPDVLHAFKNKPIYYCANHLSFIPPNAEVPWPPYARTLDYELEIGLVIGRPVPANTPPEEAAKAVAGLVLLNDFTARDVQAREIFEGNFGMAKTKNFATAMGCEVVTADELLPRLHSIDGLRATVAIDGKPVATSCTAEPEHSVADMVGYACLGEALHPGEVLGTGTVTRCAGVENGRYPKPGERLELAVEGFALPLANPVGRPQRHAEPAANGAWDGLVLRGGRFSRQRRTGCLLFLAALAALAAVLYPLLAGPSKISPVAWVPDPAPAWWKTSLPGRGALRNATILFSGELNGPESFAFDSAGRLYASLWDGRVVRTREPWRDPTESRTPIDFEDFIPAGALNPRGPDPRCGPGVLSHEEECGRPLGLHMTRGGTLILCDAYFGLVSVSAEGRVEWLASEAGGRPIVFANQPAVDEEAGVVYFADSSGRSRRREVVLLVLESACDGRLLRYDISKRPIPSLSSFLPGGRDPALSSEASVLAEGLCFPNGLLLSPDRRTLVVAETTRMRLRALDAATGRPLGPETPGARLSVPCMPDNLAWLPPRNASGAGAGGPSFLVGCANQYGLKFSLPPAIAGYPGLRKVVASLIPQDLIARFIPPYGVVLEVGYSEDRGAGAPLLTLRRALTDARGGVAHVSEAAATPEGGLLLGSYRNDHAAYLSKAALDAALGLGPGA